MIEQDKKLLNDIIPDIINEAISQIAEENVDFYRVETLSSSSQPMQGCIYYSRYACGGAYQAICIWSYNFTTISFREMSRVARFSLNNPNCVKQIGEYVKNIFSRSQTDRRAFKSLG